MMGTLLGSELKASSCDKVSDSGGDARNCV